MNKNAIQRYAVWARTEMIAQVSQRAYQYEITPEGYGDINAVSISGRLLSDSERKQRQGVIRQIQAKGYTQAMEEVAYTWFNRFIALRFMEVNNYLPTHIRVFTDSSGAFKPEILTQALHLDLPNLDMDKVAHLIEENQTEDLYRYLLLTQCNALNSALPRMFESLGSYTELLLPNNILRQDGIIGRMVSDIPEEDWTDQVQIIGWLYQYYNAELKDETFALLKKNVKVTKERIPSATQLFTPDWIVRYMVENSLGRLWIEGHPDDELKASWKYYLDEAEQEPDVQAQLDANREEYRTLRPQDIKVIDPCMGSGHILVYAFDVLVQIYKRAGYSERDAAHNILENNLYGLDIDDRAAQLAYFAVMMKARQYDRRIFMRSIQPNIYGPGPDSEIQEFGSLLLVENDNRIMPFEQVSIMEESNAYRRLLAQQYNVVVTNPPYMGSSNMNSVLSNYLKDNYADFKSDSFSAFIVRAIKMLKPHGYAGFFVPYVWMFIQSYEKLRAVLCGQKTIETLIQFEYSAFEEATVPVCAFVFSNFHTAKKGCYFRLTDFRGGMEVQKQKVLDAIKDHNCGYYYETNSSKFFEIPGAPIAYWANDSIFHAFNNEKLVGDIAEVKIGMGTGKNQLFVRQWWEVNYFKIDFSLCSISDLDKSIAKWFPYNKGGDYRLWYGNLQEILWFDSQGRKLMNTMSGHRENGGMNYYFKKGITWTFISSNNFGVRLRPSGSLFDVAGSTLFCDDKLFDYLLAFLSSSVCNYILKILNPTMNYQAGNIKSLPIIIEDRLHVSSISRRNVSLSKEDWDSFETSWDFIRHPMVSQRSLIRDSFLDWSQKCDSRFAELKSNEEELNRIFIEMYCLQNYLIPKVEEKDVTVRRADLSRDIHSLISYAVGCMFGRYSLDTPGLAYAGGDWDTSKYTSFIPNPDNVIPICDDEYFEDDIMGLFVKWLQIAFGVETLEENLKFIADALGGKGNPREVIRNYFLTGFYADHLKVYQKCPIYWLFDSGKKNGFKALIYIHRYRSDLLACLRTDYVHEQQERYRTQLKHIGDAMGSASAAERVKLVKQQKKLQEQAHELQKYEEKIHHLADQNIKIDLDDGVAHNYDIFADVLAKRK